MTLLRRWSLCWVCKSMMAGAASELDHAFGAFKALQSTNLCACSFCRSLCCVCKSMMAGAASDLDHAFGAFKVCRIRDLIMHLKR
eukprot:jgi/Chrzof1/2961/Cz12g06050.t1